MSTMKHLKQFFSNALLISLLLVMIIIASSVFIGLRTEKSKWPRFFGNSDENISHVCENTDANDFTFIVVGDVQGVTATFESMLDIIRDDRPAFAVVLGDVVREPTVISHKLFALEMQEYSRDIPMFIVVGNHDIDTNSFGTNDFEKLYGPSQFSFRIGEYLFVFLNDVLPYDANETYIDFLEGAILAQKDNIKKIFVFMHIPVISIDGSLRSIGLDDSERFIELAKKYNIDYVFTGDYHGYMKSQKDNTVYIISGGGGAKLDEGEHGKFHHLLRISANNGLIEETVLASKKHLETFELIERELATSIWPVISHNFISAAITIFIFCLSSYCVFYCVIKKRHRKQRPALS
jgi:predicted MPP superfamily phosphohydrolase